MAGGGLGVAGSLPRASSSWLFAAAADARLSSLATVSVRPTAGPEGPLTLTDVGGSGGGDAQLRAEASSCSGGLCLSADPGRGLRAGTGLREGMMAGRAMLTICRPGT